MLFRVKFTSNVFSSKTLALHTGAREIWIDQSGFSRQEKPYCPYVHVSWQKRHWDQARFLTGDGIKYSRKGIYVPQTISHRKKLKIWNILCLQGSNLAPKIVVRWASPCMIIVVLLWTKCAVLRQIEAGILLLIIKRGYSNSSVVFILASGD